jgi:arabinofuranosyltransferase
MKTKFIILSLIVAAVVVTGLAFFHYIPDDTYITLRYARNVMKGMGFVYNAGERVEGYTNFLWLLILTVKGQIGFPLVFSARALSLVFSLGTLALLPYAALRMGAAEGPSTVPSSIPRPTEAPRSIAEAEPSAKPMPRAETDHTGWYGAFALMLPSLLLAASPPFLTWALSGTEIPLFTFLLLWGFVLMQRGDRPCAAFIVFALLGLVRPEGALFYLLAWIYLIVRPGRRIRVFAQGLAVAAVFYTPYLLWKWRYFHALLPNTFYAKTGPLGLMFDNGTQYVFGFIFCYGYLFFVGWYLLRRSGDRRAAAVPGVFGAALVIVHLFLGGDWMPNHRLLLPILPFIMLTFSRGLIGSAGFKHRREAPLFALIALFLIMIPGAVGYERFTLERVTVGAYARLGERLREILPPNTSIGCGSTGAIGYYTEMPIVDILGLTDRYIARHGQIVGTQPGHLKTDGRYVIERRPDLLLLGNVQIHRGTREESSMPTKVQEKEITRQPEFSKDYLFVNIPLGSDFYLSSYKLREFFLPL